MEESSNKKQEKNQVSKVRTFPVSFALKNIKENLIINTNTTARPSKEQIINQAIKFHLKGSILEATKYYQYCLQEGFNDHRVFSNYGAILQSLGKLQEAENFIRKAIEINPQFADSL